MWFLLMEYKQCRFMAIVVSAAGMMGPKKGGCVLDFVSYLLMYALPAFTLQEYTNVEPLNLFLQWAEGSLKGALSVRFKFRSDMLC
jgi:hypothetical protein